MTGLHTIEFYSRDFDELRSNLERWDQSYRQLSAGQFSGGLRYIAIDGMEIFDIQWATVIHYRGLTPEGTIGFGLPMALSGQPRYLSVPSTLNELLIQRSGNEGDLIGTRDFRLMVFTVSEHRFLQRLAQSKKCLRQRIF